MTDLYIRTRVREGRLLSDHLVAQLPRLPDSHHLAAEWRLRAHSSRRLIRHLRAQRRRLRVLELGCGNGWLARRIAAISQTSVMGTDVNDLELEQARRVFGHHANLEFAHHDMLDEPLPMEHPDVIVVASAIQYVTDPAELIGRWLRALAVHGEIHILDSPIYAGAEVAAARERSDRHYAAIGVPEMSDAYHHHTWQSFEPFGADVLHRPGAGMNRLRRVLLGSARSPFPWICIRGDAVR